MKIIFKRCLIFPGIILFLMAPITLFPAIKQDLNSGWVRGEFYTTIFIQVLFFMVISFYSYYNCIKTHWTQKYLMNVGVFVALGFYYYVSLLYDSSVPTLGAMVITTIIFIIPGLLVLQAIATLIRFFLKDNF